MHVEFKPGTLFQYSCKDCGYKRDGLLDHPMYSWSCPKCGGMPIYEEIKNESSPSDLEDTIVELERK